jgi:hypothetical protein
MQVNERQYKAYGYVRIGLYSLSFLLAAFFWSVLIMGVLPRIILPMRLLLVNLYFSLGLVALFAALSAFWFVNRLLVVPTLTQVLPDGFRSNAPYRYNELFIHFSEIGTIFEFGFGTLVSTHCRRDRRNYWFIFSKDTDGYYRLLDTLKDGLNEFRTTR